MTQKDKKLPIECLFGFHKYTIPSKQDKNVLICENCKKFGRYKSSTGYEIWYEYDEKGNKIHRRDSGGYEEWYGYDKEGNMIHKKNNVGDEDWFHEGKWVLEKPKNWIYENDSNNLVRNLDV